MTQDRNGVRPDMEGPGGDELREAEEEGRSHARGEAPAIRKK